MTATAKTATTKPATTTPRPMSVLYYWMALGTFAIGTEGFMIAPLLPNLAEDLSVGLVTAGQLVTVFTLSYAFSSPILDRPDGRHQPAQSSHHLDGGLCGSERRPPRSRRAIGC